MFVLESKGGAEAKIQNVEKKFSIFCRMRRRKTYNV